LDKLDSEILEGQGKAPIGFGPGNQDLVDAMLLTICPGYIAFNESLELHQG
jgi:hypothetical protein